MRIICKYLSAIKYKIPKTVAHAARPPQFLALGFNYAQLLTASQSMQLACRVFLAKTLDRCMDKQQNKEAITAADLDRIVEMAWEDRTSFDTIYDQFGISEAEVIKIMRKSMKRSSFLMWRERVSGRKTKHAKTSEAQRFRCSQQDKFKSR